VNCSQLVASHRSLFLRLRRDVELEEDGYFYAVFGGELGSATTTEQ
jgi:hypothetical protein